MTGYGRKWRMEGDEISRREKIFELVDKLDLQTPGPRGREVRIVRHHPHAKGDRSPAQLAADASHADDAERFVVKLHALKICSVPFSRADIGICLRNLPGHAQQKRKCVLGR